jgi:hypothetical protein
MANRFWTTLGTTGGTGNWSDTQNWSTATGGAAGASVPGISDSARYDGNSGTGTATLDISPTVQSLSFAPTTSFAGTFAFGTNTVTLNSTGTVFVGSTSMTVTGTPQIILTETVPSATSRTINPSAVTEANSISFRITGSTGALTLGTGSYLNLDFTDGTNPTGYGGALGGNTPTVYGDFKASTNMTQTPVGNAIIFAGAVVGTRDITTAGVTFDRPFTFNSTATVATDVVFRLLGALTSGDTRTCTLTAGRLRLNSHTMTIGIFSSNNTNVRRLDFGSTGSIVLTSASATADVTIFNTTDSTNFIVSGPDPYIDVEGAPTSFVRSILTGTTSLGGSASNAISFYINAGSDTINFGTVNCVVNDLVFGTNVTLAANAALQIYGSYSNGNYATITGGTNAWTFRATSLKAINSATAVPINNPVNFDGIGGIWQIVSNPVVSDVVTLINGTLEIQDGAQFTVGSFATSGTNQKFLSSTSPGTQATISAASGTNTVSYLTIQDSNATGGATFYATDPTNVNAGNNTGWIFRNPTGGSGGGTRFGFGFRI